MQYPPIQLANTFISKYGDRAGISHMKLQKLVYFTYGWHLAFNDSPLLNEQPEVWKYGPVFRSLYHALSTKGMEPITVPHAFPWEEEHSIPSSDDLALRWVSFIWDKYGSLDALTLSDMTHSAGSPWQKEAEARNYKVPMRHKIPDAIIKEYFKGEASKLNAATA